LHKIFHHTRYLNRIRIHRYGQKKEVHVINLVASDTREGAVFTRLFEKLDTIRDELGTDRVYDVIGELFPKRNLAQLMLEAAASTRDYTQLLSEIEASLDPVQLNLFEDFNQDTLVSPYINLPQVSELQQRLREHGLIPEYTREFFRKTFETLNSRLHPRKDEFFRIDRVPIQITKISQDTQFKQMYPTLTGRSYPKVTFDKTQALIDPTAEFISFGHPLFEAALHYVEKKYTEDLKTGAYFSDPDGRFNGIIVFYEGEIRDGTNTIAGKQLFAFYLPQDSEAVEQINPIVVWDFQEASSTSEPIQIQDLEDKVGGQVRLRLDEYKKELTEERKRQVDIKRRYGITSLERLILNLDSELLDLAIKSDNGEDVKRLVQNKTEQKDRYEEEKEKLEESCQREVTLVRKPPIFTGAIRVCPAIEGNETETSMPNRLEIERIGMEQATRHEEAQSCVVEDVSAESLGFDLRSKTPDGKVRCIEVKARADRAPIVLTSNEWFRAKQLKDDYFLYVVLNAATQPESYIIQNPASQISAVRQITEVRYQVPLSEITKRREPV